MTGDLTAWNYGLLFAALCVILGVVGVVSSQLNQERWLATGMVLQGVVLTFVVGGTYFRSSVDLHLGGLVVAGLLIIQSLCKPNPTVDPKSPLEEDEA